MAWACGTEWVTGMNSTSNGPISTTLAVGDRCACRSWPSRPGLLDAVAGQPERERRAVDRQRVVAEVADAVVVAQQVLDAADVVLVAVGEHQRRMRLAFSRR